jgi:hypothetical protein
LLAVAAARSVHDPVAVLNDSFILPNPMAARS